MLRASRILALLLPLVASCAQPSRRYSGEDREPLLEAARLEAGGGPEAAALLGEALRSPFARVRERALRALSRLEPAPDPAPFEAILRTDGGANVRSQAAHALGRLRGAASPALVEALRDADPGVRRESVRALSWFDNTPPGTIEGASRDPDPLVRREAIFAMARTRSPLLEARIAEGVRLENDESVRWGIFKVLAWRPEAARGLEADLLRAAADPNWLVALHALVALRRGTRAEGVEEILRLLERRAFPWLLDDAAVALLASHLERESLLAADRSRIEVFLEDVAAGKVEGLHPAVVEKVRAGKRLAAAAPSLDGAPPADPSRDGADQVLRDLLSPGGLFARPRNPKVVVSIRSRPPIVFDVFAAEAPRHAAAFIDLVRSGRLDGVPVTRLDPALGILIGPAAGGAAVETVPEAQAAGRALPLETFPVSHLRGALLAAPPRGFQALLDDDRASWGGASPHIPGAGRFLIALVPLPELEGRVTCFGHIVLGGEALERIEEGDIVETVRIFDGWSISPAP